MFQQLRIATKLLLVVTLLTGVVYPAIVTAIAQVAFAPRANGSLLRQDEQIVGSELIGQPFTKPEYFWGRLSATAPYPYNAASSGGSNFGPLNPAFKDAVEARIAALTREGTLSGAIPVDLVTSSGSGLDPQISPAAAEFQLLRIATARKLPEEALRRIVRQQTAGRQFGVLGEPGVNVLKLNLALDRLRTEPEGER